MLVLNVICEGFGIINMALSLKIKKLNIALSQGVTLYLLKTKGTATLLSEQ